MNVKQRNAGVTLLLALMICCPARGQHSAMTADQAKELASLDAMATMIGSAGSWIRNDAEAAIHLFAHQDRILECVREKLDEYSGIEESKDHYHRRLRDRKKQLEHCLKSWEQTIPQYLNRTPNQIATELKRQKDAVDRYVKSKRPRPSSFAHIPKSVWETKSKIDVLTAAGADTTELRAEQQQVEQQVRDLLASIDQAELAKSTNAPRDAYNRDDRETIEAFIRQLWEKEHPSQPIARIVMPSQSWSNTYGATVLPDSRDVVPHEVDRMTVYVAVEKTETIMTLHPVRLSRLHYKINGKRIGKRGPQELRQIPTHEFAFDVLSKNIR